MFIRKKVSGEPFFIPLLRGQQGGFARSFATDFYLSYQQVFTYF